MIRIFGDVPVRPLSYQDFENYKLVRLKEIKPVSVNSDLRTIKSIFSKAVRYKIIDENPLSHNELIKVPENEIHCLSYEEIKVLFNSIKEHTIKQIVAFGLYTCCRLSEILNLKWKNIDFERNIIKIINTDSFVTKNRYNRTIPMHSVVVNILQNMMSVNDVKLNEETQLESYLFKKDDGSRYSVSYISHKFKYYTRLCGLSEFLRFHGLRHTSLSALARKGVPINHIKDIAGHRNIKTTQIYLHSNNKDLKDSIDKLDY
jgi:integrase/recombinase XerD